MNSAAVFMVISFPCLGSGEFIYACIFLNIVSWVLDMCLSEPQAHLSTPHHPLCLSLPWFLEPRTRAHHQLFSSARKCSLKMAKDDRGRELDRYNLFLVFLFVSVLEMKGGFKWSFEFSFLNKGLPPSPPKKFDSSLISSCASSSLAFCMMYSAYKVNKWGDNIQP